MDKWKKMAAALACISAGAIWFMKKEMRGANVHSRFYKLVNNPSYTQLTRLGDLSPVFDDQNTNVLSGASEHPTPQSG